MSDHKKAKAKNGKVGLPDLTAVFKELFDACILARVACRAMEECDDDNYGPAIFALHQCVGAVTEVSDKLREAAIQLPRFRRKNVNAQGGAS